MINSEYIAEKPDGSRLTLSVRVGLPEPDPLPGGDYRCRVEIQALSFDQYVHGVDELQAFCLVVPCLKQVFEPLLSDGWKFYFPQDPDLDNPKQSLDLLPSYFPTW